MAVIIMSTALFEASVFYYSPLTPLVRLALSMWQIYSQGSAYLYTAVRILALITLL